MKGKIYNMCNVQGCAGLAEKPKRYCEAHANAKEQERKASDQAYRANRKDNVEQKFYKSKEWTKVRALRMMMDHGLCQPCFRNNQITKATRVHHIVSIKDDWEKRLVVNNLECVCTACHNRLHR